jgi:hypothetical protein
MTNQENIKYSGPTGQPVGPVAFRPVYANFRQTRRCNLHEALNEHRGYSGTSQKSTTEHYRQIRTTLTGVLALATRR